MSVYQVDYDGYYAMSWHDKEENALKRWFDNYKVERYASFACETEWLVVKEVDTDTRRKKRFICEIGDDGRGTKREVIMDHTAPPAPMLTFAAKRRWEPPPPKSGDRVICIDDRPPAEGDGADFVLLRPRYGEEYTVRGIHYEPHIQAQGIFLEGLENPSIVWADGTDHEWPFDSRRFRLANCLLKLPSKAVAVP